MARARVLAFQEAYPEVDLEIVESFDEQKLLTAAASDTLPDVLWLDRFQTATWASRGVIQPLTPFIERDNYDTSPFYEHAIDEATYEGEIYGIPGGDDVRALFVNLDHLEGIGVEVDSIDTSDWDLLNSLGEQLVKRNGDVIERWGFDHKCQAGNFWLWGNANGGDFINDDFTEATFDDEKLVEALQWAVEAYDAQGGYQDYLAISSSWQGDEQFARGEVSMSLYEQWMLSAAISTISPEINFTVLPIRDRGSGPDGPMTSFSGGNAWCITTNAKNPDAAWEFIKFLHTDDTWMIGARAVKELREENGNPYFPSLTAKKSADQLQIEELYEPVSEPFNEAVEFFPNLLDASHNREISGSPVAGQLSDIMNQEGVTPALSGDMSPQEALENADRLAQDAIDFT